jgi:hypothetical protein
MARRSPHLLALSLALTLLVVALPAATSNAADPQPTAVSVPGDFNSEIGCPADWSPDCAQAQLTRRSNDDVWSMSVALPAGTFAYKAALNDTWDVNYGAHGVAGGDNIPLVVPTGGATVTFFYDNATHWVTADISTPIVTAAGSFQSELGCPADWSPDCLRSWLEDLDGDGVYTFTTTAIPAGSWETKATVGLSWDVNYGAGGVPGGDNIPFTVAHDGDATTFSFDSTSHILTITSGNGPTIDLKTPRAYWLSQRYIGWALGNDAANRTYRLYSAPTGGLAVDDTGVTGGSWIPLQYTAAGLPASIKTKFPARSRSRTRTSARSRSSCAARSQSSPWTPPVPWSTARACRSRVSWTTCTRPPRGVLSGSPGTERSHPSRCGRPPRSRSRSTCTPTARPARPSPREPSPKAATVSGPSPVTRPGRATTSCTTSASTCRKPVRCKTIW